MKRDIVILHGTCGSPDGNWFPWLAARAEADGHRVFIPKLPSPEGQSLENWKKALPPIGPDTILVGHSCGATFLLHILESLDAPAAGSILVSGFVDKLGNEFFDNLNETFTNHKFDWEKIRRNAGQVAIFHGDNDPYVPLAAAQKVADGLGAPLTIVPNGGHLNSESGYTQFTEILEAIKNV
ncbi:MAG: alpha/beta hydrolase [Rickettsiales bacterium]|jgi:predicted alpha/beta hydrolase family esterase|nr:alpha/beta hydrolase [Rickettsiales bacterium]